MPVFPVTHFYSLQLLTFHLILLNSCTNQVQALIWVAVLASILRKSSGAVSIDFNGLQQSSILNFLQDWSLNFIGFHLLPSQPFQRPLPYSPTKTLHKNQCFSQTLLYYSYLQMFFPLWWFICTDLHACRALKFFSAHSLVPTFKAFHPTLIFSFSVFKFLFAQLLSLTPFYFIWIFDSSWVVLSLPQDSKLCEDKDHASSLWVCLACCLIYGGHSVDV